MGGTCLLLEGEFSKAQKKSIPELGALAISMLWTDIGFLTQSYRILLPIAFVFGPWHSFWVQTKGIIKGKNDMQYCMNTVFSN